MVTVVNLETAVGLLGAYQSFRVQVLVKAGMLFPSNNLRVC